MNRLCTASLIDLDGDYCSFDDSIRSTLLLID